MPEISVLLPVYNAEKTIGETVRSVLRQTFSDFELLAIDDGSQDKSLQILNSFVDDRLKISHHSNCGLAKTLNTAARHATGKYLARIDADDICLPERFQTQIAYLQSHPSIVVVSSAVQYINEDGRYLGRSFPSTHIRFIRKQLLRGYCCIAHPAVMMRTQAFRDAGGYNERIGGGLLEDAMLWAKLINGGYGIGNIPTPLVQYRITAGAISSVQLDDECHKMVRDIFANINAVSDAQARKFNEKYAELRRDGMRTSRKRIDMAQASVICRVYDVFKRLKCSDTLSERLVYLIRTPFDVFRS
jgi:glycosyltransferase involved in cell wall biosynthesis